MDQSTDSCVPGLQQHNDISQLQLEKQEIHIPEGKHTIQDATTIIYCDTTKTSSDVRLTARVKSAQVLKNEENDRPVVYNSNMMEISNGPPVMENDPKSGNNTVQSFSDTEMQEPVDHEAVVPCGHIGSKITTNGTVLKECALEFAESKNNSDVLQPGQQALDEILLSTEECKHDSTNVNATLNISALQEISNTFSDGVELPGSDNDHQREDEEVELLFEVDKPSPANKANYRSTDLNGSCRSSVCDSSSSSDGSEEFSDSSSSSTTESEEAETLSRERRKNGPVKSKAIKNVIRTKGELTLEDLPPIQDLNINLPEEEPMEMTGNVFKIVDQLVLIQALKGTRPLDIESVLFLEGRKPLGQVFDVLGPVAHPYYAIRFNNAEEIITREIVEGLPVFSAPGREEVTAYVFTDELRKQKGSDASWKDNNEPPVQCLDFSDDEEERRIRHKWKAKNRGQSGSDVEVVGEVKSPNLNQRGRGRGTFVQRHNTPPRLIRPSQFQAPPQQWQSNPNQVRGFVPPLPSQPPVFGLAPPVFGYPPPNFVPNQNGYGGPWLESPQNCGQPFLFPTSNFGPQNMPFQPCLNQTGMPMVQRPPPPLPNYFMMPPPPPPPQFPTTGCPLQPPPIRQNLFLHPPP